MSCTGRRQTTGTTQRVDIRATLLGTFDLCGDVVKGYARAGSEDSAVIAPMSALGMAVSALGATLIVLPRIEKLGLGGLGLQGCGSLLTVLGLAPLLVGLGIALENRAVLVFGVVLAILLATIAAIITWDVWGRWVWNRSM